MSIHKAEHPVGNLSKQNYFIFTLGYCDILPQPARQYILRIFIKEMKNDRGTALQHQEPARLLIKI